ncbi:Protein of unknown function [Bacillus mycoides]|nr:Protein of unknown function [Bacillus mycoides]
MKREGELKAEGKNERKNEAMLIL